MLRSDYILQMVQSFYDALGIAFSHAQLGESEQALAVLGRVVGEALEMRPEVALSFAPQSLVSMVELARLDETLALYLSFTLLKMSEILETQGSPLAQLRRDQAHALAVAYGFPLGEEPPDISCFTKLD